MKDTLVTAEIVEPYAEALMSLAQSHNLADRIGEDVRVLRDLIGSSEELDQFLSNPLAKPEAQKAVLRQLLGEQGHAYTLNFLMLLVDRRRIFLLEGICKQYLARLRQLNQTVLAEVATTVELTEDQKQAIREKVIQLTEARQVELDVSLDPELLGGVIVKVGSQVFDASLRGQLRRISLSLGSAA